MTFIDQWQEQLKNSLMECAKLVPTVLDVDLKYELMVVGLLWPIRQPIQDFNLEAIGAVQEVVGDRAKHVMQVVQAWGDDPLTVARNLAGQEFQSGELGAALRSLISYFGAFSIFTGHLAEQINEAKSAPTTDTAATEPAMRRPRVFVSYIQSDGEALAAEVYERLRTEDVRTWQDLSQFTEESTWWQQVTHALDRVEFLVLIMTPAALKSELVRKQWRYAYRNGVCIYPVFKDINLDFMALPRWIRQIHFYNLNQEWAKLIQDLKGNCETPRPPFMAEDLPDYFVERPEELDQLIRRVYNKEQDEGIASTTVVYGAGGYGKTMLVTALCHNENVRQVFDDGILWVTLGENPGDLSRYVIDLVEVLSGERPGFAGLDAAVVRLSELLADRDILLVVDDVWNVAHLRPFLHGGSRCAHLITTRDVTTIPSEAHSLNVGTMQPNEAVTLLSNKIPDENLDSMRHLASRLGEWPLLLRLTNGTLRDRIKSGGASLSEALSYVNDALDKQGLTAFDVDNPVARNQAVSQTIEVSLELLNDEQRTRYGELVVFPEDVNIPLVALERLWGATGDFDDFDTEELCDRLHELSLLSHFDLANRTIRLHKVMHDYLAYQQGTNLPTLHNQLLDAYRPILNGAAPKATGSWGHLPPEEPYLWTYLAYHLVKAERHEELLNTVQDLYYLAAKTYLLGGHYTESDVLTAESIAPDVNTLKLLRRTLSQASHLLVRCESIGQAANTLHSRLIHQPELAQIAARAEPYLPKPLLTARHPLPDLPEPHLVRTVRGHTAGVLSCAISGDGSLMISVAKDNTVSVWETDTGIERFSFVQQEADVWGCDIDGEGSVIVYGLSDGTLKLWGVQAETERLSWSGHKGGIVDCAISADGSVIVSASKDQTLKVWDAQLGIERFTLTGHQRSVTGCDISADGSVVVSASNDGTVRVWDANTGTERFEFTIRLIDAGMDRLTFFSQRDVNFSCAVSADGAVVAATSSMGTLTVWDAYTGAERMSLAADKRGVRGCALNADGLRLVCALANDSLKVWDTTTGSELLTLIGHNRAINDCDISGDGSIIISVSDDQTLNVWDGSSEATQIIPASQSGAAQNCAMSADGMIAVSAMANNTLVVWDVATGSERLTLKGHTRKINTCAISPDGTTIISGSQDKSLIVWDTETGAKQHTLTGHTWAVNGCAASADGTLIVSASEDKTLKVWDAAAGGELLSIKAHTRGVNDCALSVDGKLAVSASGDSMLKVWDTASGTQLATLRGHTAWVNRCAISPDGSVIVSASYDKTLKVWDAPGYIERVTLEGHTQTITGCAISADGAIVVSAARDKTLKVWDAHTGECLSTLFINEPLQDCTCSADANNIVAVGSSGLYFLRLEQ